MHKNLPIEKLDYSIYNSQSLVPTCDMVCIVNGRFLYFNEDDKLDLHVKVVTKYPIPKNIHQFFSLNALK